MTDHTPKVSVCLLSYNHRAVLPETIASIQRQDLSDFELIISDDRSRDDSWSLLQQLAREDARIRLMRPERNLGMAENANFALRHARSPYVAMLHHDDLCQPSLLRRWFEVIDNNPSVGFVSNAYAIEGTTRVDYHPGFRALTPGKWILERKLMARFDCPVRGTAMIRKTAWDAIGGMRAHFGLLADVDLWMRLAARWDVGYVPEPLLVVRCARPADYPLDYVEWTWKRRRILYEIHATNGREYYGDTWRGRLERARFRARVSADELRWLGYAIVKQETRMLKTSDGIENPYELKPVRWLRRQLQRAASIHSQKPERSKES